MSKHNTYSGEVRDSLLVLLGGTILHQVVPIINRVLGTNYGRDEIKNDIDNLRLKTRERIQKMNNNEIIKFDDLIGGGGGGGGGDGNEKKVSSNIPDFRDTSKFKKINLIKEYAKNTMNITVPSKIKKREDVIRYIEKHNQEQGGYETTNSDIKSNFQGFTNTTEALINSYTSNSLLVNETGKVPSEDRKYIEGKTYTMYTYDQDFKNYLDKLKEIYLYSESNPNDKKNEDEKKQIFDHLIDIAPDDEEYLEYFDETLKHKVKDDLKLSKMGRISAETATKFANNLINGASAIAGSIVGGVSVGGVNSIVGSVGGSLGGIAGSRIGLRAGGGPVGGVVGDLIGAAAGAHLAVAAVNYLGAGAINVPPAVQQMQIGPPGGINIAGEAPVFGQQAGLLQVANEIEANLGEKTLTAKENIHTQYVDTQTKPTPSDVNVEKPTEITPPENKEKVENKVSSDAIVKIENEKDKEPTALLKYDYYQEKADAVKDEKEDEEDYTLLNFYMMMENTSLLKEQQEFSRILQDEQDLKNGIFNQKEDNFYNNEEYNLLFVNKNNGVNIFIPLEYSNSNFQENFTRVF